MPFAVIAVLILTISVACGAMAAGYERASEETRNGEKDAAAVDAALDSMTAFVDRGLAEIIWSVSVGSGGTVEDREAEFGRKAEEWLDYQFPMVDNGVRAELRGSDIKLSTQALSVASTGIPDGGYLPAYLKATGTVDVKISTGTGSADSTLQISTDGSCALPLAAEQGSLFESMAAEGSVTLEQMMRYQLSNLAQIRIMNGYGSTSAYGLYGTDGILTKRDVLDAYAVCVDLLSLACFRDGGGPMASETSADPAEILLSEGGCVTVDLQAAYAQALMGMVDDMALKWREYFCGDGAIPVLQAKLSIYRNAGMLLDSFVSGRDPFDAGPYLRAVMEVNGFDESDYRFPGSGTTSITVGGITFEIENPAADVYESAWLKKFAKKGMSSDNWLKEYIRSILVSAAMEVAEGSGLGAYRVMADPYDGIRLADTIAESIGPMLDGCGSDFQRSISSSLKSAEFSDPLYGAVCDEIVRRSGSYVLEGEFAGRVRAALSKSLPETAVEEFMSGEGYEKALSLYRSAVLDDLEVFEDPERMPQGKSGFLGWAMSEICAFGLDASGITQGVREKMAAMCEEMCDLCDANAMGGEIELAGIGTFDVVREGGGISKERLEASITTSPKTADPKISEKKCTHTVGFRESAVAAYSTVFEVSLQDTVRYSIKEAGAMSSAPGSESCLISGEFPVDISFEVAAASCWALSGVNYRPSCSFLDDAWEAAMPLIEPILEPLLETLKIVEKIMAAIGEDVAEAARYVQEYVEKLNGELMECLETIKEWAAAYLEPFITELWDSVGVKICLKDQSIEMTVMGYNLKITTDAASLAGKTKTLFTFEIGTQEGDRRITAGVTLKTTGKINGDDIRITGFGSITDPGDKETGREPWKVKIKVDPFMKSSKHLITADGRAGKVSVSLAIPEIVQYHELGMKLSDVPGLGEILSSIPIPLVGLKAELDAGFSLKYSAPVKFGLLINEFESNPSGDDKTGEWVELLNNTDSTIELDGYTLTASSDWKTKIMPLSGSIGPGEILELDPTFTMVNSSGKRTKTGEALTLKDPDGAVIDKTPTLKDDKDDSRTWHREFDGGTEWVFGEGTEGTSNGSMLQAAISAGDLKDIAWESVQKAFDEVGYITDSESLATFMKSLVKHTVDGTIEKVTGCIVEASVYVKADITDLASMAECGFTIALRTDSQLAEDCLKYVAGKLESMILGMDNPYSIDIGEAFMEDVDLEIDIRAGVGIPQILYAGSEDPEADVEAVFRTNLSAISKLIGTDAGKPELVCGLRITGCPLACIPDGVKADKNMDRDLWLVKVSIKWRTDSEASAQ